MVGAFVASAGLVPAEPQPTAAATSAGTTSLPDSVTDRQEFHAQNDLGRTPIADETELIDFGRSGDRGKDECDCS